MSYSHNDRHLVRRLADDLDRASILLWWDAWEMKPGDSLRERIGEGISAAKFFLIILSKASLRSNWVKYELDSGMLLEIERQGVRVIPTLTPGLLIEEVPTDLRTKRCLLLDGKNYLQSVEALVDLIKPERRQRAELLERLRNPTGDFANAYVLRKYAIEVHDQNIEKAALDGLTKLGGADSVVVVAERALNTWGMSSIQKAIKVLGKLSSDFGLLALSSTILRDSRFLVDRLNLMIKLSPHVNRSLGDFDGATPWELHERSHNLMSMLYLCDDLDVRYGAALSRSLLQLPTWGRNLEAAPPNLLAEALDFANQSLPGLADVLRNAEPESRL